MTKIVYFNVYVITRRYYEENPLNAKDVEFMMTE